MRWDAKKGLGFSTDTSYYVKYPLSSVKYTKRLTRAATTVGLTVNAFQQEGVDVKGKKGKVSQRYLAMTRSILATASLTRSSG